MWILVPLKDGEEPYFLPAGKTYSVGRQSCDIVVPNDKSVSRSHAEISVRPDGLFVRDTSKYGAFQCKEGENEFISVDKTNFSSISLNSRIRFGLLESFFDVKCHKIIISSSSLPSSSRGELKELIQKCSGELKKEWSESCTHLVMNKVVFSEKFFFALIDGADIIHLSWLKAIVQRSNVARRLPDCAPHIPEDKNHVLTKYTGKRSVSLLPSPARKRLFSGKTLLFFSKKQFNSLHGVVRRANGVCFDASDENIDEKFALLHAKDFVINPVPEEEEEEVSESDVEKKSRLEEVGFSVLPASEILRSLLLGSTDGFFVRKSFPQEKKEQEIDEVKEIGNSKNDSCVVFAPLLIRRSSSTTRTSTGSKKFKKQFVSSIHEDVKLTHDSDDEEGEEKKSMDEEEFISNPQVERQQQQQQEEEEPKHYSPPRKQRRMFRK